LNLGCGKTYLPSAPPPGHEIADPSIYDYPNWLNVDKVQGVGADFVFDLFTYPWPFADNSFGGALCAHLVEHIPHEIRSSVFQDNNIDLYDQRWQQLQKLQDGWYAFFSELYRVLAPGSLVHIIAPYGFSDGGITDPSHTRYLTASSFTHSMTPNISDGKTFQYANGGINFQVVMNEHGVHNIVYRFTEYASAIEELLNLASSIMPQSIASQVIKRYGRAMMLGIFNNMCYDFYIQLKVVK
jgi:hypothetical protein